MAVQFPGTPYQWFAFVDFVLQQNSGCFPYEPKSLRRSEAQPGLLLLAAATSRRSLEALALTGGLAKKESPKGLHIPKQSQKQRGNKRKQQKQTPQNKDLKTNKTKKKHPKDQFPKTLLPTIRASPQKTAPKQTLQKNPPKKFKRTTQPNHLPPLPKRPSKNFKNPKIQKTSKKSPKKLNKLKKPSKNPKT